MAKLSGNARPTGRSERVVVDEIIGDGVARLLRAKRAEGATGEDLGVDAWDDETEDFIDAWKVEAFVGFPSEQRLREGDVFFIKDGSKLNNQYGVRPKKHKVAAQAIRADFAKPRKALPRKVAREIHLLQPWDQSKEFARNEIKEGSYKLLAAELSTSEKEKRKNFRIIEDNIKAMSKSSSDEGGA